MVSIDENLVFVALITVFLIFIINKQPKLIATLGAIILFYYIYKRNFTNPKDLATFITNKFTEAFEPCSFGNSAYCNNDSTFTNSNLTILPEIMRSGQFGNINNNVKLNLKDYAIDRNLKMGLKELTLDELFNTIPILLDYKTYFEKLVKFIIDIKTDDNIQKDFLAKKLKHKLLYIYYNSYNTIKDSNYPINNFNELLYSEREFDDTLNIFVFLALNNDDSYKLSQLQKEFNDLNNKLNEYIVEKVNDITPNDYNITTSILPKPGEPIGVSLPFN
jgi:hypothetical protein